MTGTDALGATMPAAVLTGPAALEVRALPVPVPGVPVEPLPAA